MTFEGILDQAIEMLRRRGRLTYRALKRQFTLDDDYLADLKETILYTYPQVVHDDGWGLIWTGAPPAPVPDAGRGREAESRFHALFAEVMALLQRERRVTYRRLKYIFGVDDAFLEDVREELVLRRVAIEDEGKVLVWTGEVQPAVYPAVAVPIQPAALEAATVTSPVPPELSPSTTAPDTPHDGPPVSPEAMPPDAPHDEPAVTPEPVRSAPEAERRQLTVQFCDLADSTQLSQQLDPEDLREVIRAYQETAAEVIHQFAGHIAQYLGDGLLIYFGWPKAHEDDAQRALHAGLGIVEAITTTLNPRLEREQEVQLTVRIGIHTGPVVVGEMGGGGRHENLATGETVNIAARLEGLAAPNTVVISQVTARLVRGAFALENRGPQVLKGVAEPLVVFRVLGPMEEREDDEHMSVGRPFLVGRDEESGLLVRRWEQSKEGFGQVVLVSGTAGIGKSSLVEVLRAHVQDEDVPCIAFRCSSYHRHSVLYPVIAHVERLLHCDRNDAPATTLDKLEQGLRTSRLPLEEVVPLFAGLLSVPLDDRYPAPTLTPQQQTQQTLDALVAWMLEKAEQQPVVVVWEDLQWADPSTLEMLGLVLEQTPTVPMLHVLIFRPEFALPWPIRSHMTPITLNRLERSQVEALILHLAGGKVLPVEVVQHIVAKTDGVPLYVEELTKMLLASALLRAEADAYVLTGPLLSVAIPATLQDALMARLDQLNTAKEVAQLGAVLGREFPYAMLQAISSQDEETVQAGLAQLVEAELLYQRGRLPRATYLFKHALIQDAAYQSLLRSTRQQYHQRIVQVLEEQFPETAESQPELVAHHATEAGLMEQAIGYWHVAGQRAIQRSANQEAIRHLTTGLELLTTLPDTPERTQQELDMQVILGAPLIATKGYAAPEVEHVYIRARALCQQVGDTSPLFPVLLGLRRFYLVRAEYQTARGLGQQLLALAQNVRDPACLLEAHYGLGATLLWLGDVAPARSHLEEGMALYDSQQHHSLALYSGQDPGVACLSCAAFALWLLGYPDQALQKSHEAHTLAQELSHPLSLAFALCWAAAVHQLRREEHVTQKQAEEAMDLSNEQGFPYWVTWGAPMRGWALALQGDEEGIAQIQKGLAALQAMGAELGRSWFLALLAEAYGNVGRAEEGLHVLAEALALVDKRGERLSEAELHRLKGELLLTPSADNHPEAETSFQQALTIARRQQAKSLELRAAMSLARLWQRQGRRTEARELLAPVYGWFTEGFDTADLQEAKALLDELGGESSHQIRDTICPNV